MAESDITTRARAVLAGMSEEQRTAVAGALAGGIFFGDDAAMYRNLGLTGRTGMWTELGCECSRLLKIAAQARAIIDDLATTKDPT